jgi:hypothetical protein
MEFQGERGTGPGVSSSSVACSQVTVSRELLTAGSEGSGGERRWRAGWVGGTRNAAGSGTLRDPGTLLETLQEVGDATGDRARCGVLGH